MEWYFNISLIRFQRTVGIEQGQGSFQSSHFGYRQKRTSQKLQYVVDCRYFQGFWPCRTILGHFSTEEYIIKSHSFANSTPCKLLSETWIKDDLDFRGKTDKKLVQAIMYSRAYYGGSSVLIFLSKTAESCQNSLLGWRSSSKCAPCTGVIQIV